MAAALLTYRRNINNSQNPAALIRSSELPGTPLAMFWLKASSVPFWDWERANEQRPHCNYAKRQ
jgi:hypothetical protein